MHDTPPTPPTHGPWRVVILPSLCLLVAMFNLTLVVAGLKELILDEMGGTVRDATLFFSVETFAYLLFAPLWGVVSDRWGRRRPLVIIGFLASAAIYAAYLWVERIDVLLALRFLQGAFSVMGWSTIMAMVLDQPDERRRGRYMGIMGSALIFGVALGAPIGGLISREAGARAPLAVASGLFLLIAIASLGLVEADTRRRQTTLRQIVAGITTRPLLLLPMAFHFVDRFTVGIFVVIFPLYLSHLGPAGADPALRGRYLAYFLLPFSLLQYFTGKLTEAVGPWKPLIWGSLLYGLLLATVGYADLFTLQPVMIGLGCLAAVMFPPTIFLTARFSDAATRGTAMGGFNLAGSLGFAIGPLFGGWAYEHYGFGFAFVASGSLEVVAALLAGVWLLRRVGVERKIRGSIY